MKIVEVVAGIIILDNKILCVQRPSSKFDYVSEKFEFPGGKIEENESNKDALKRELFEELSLKCEIGDFFLTVEHVYPDFKIIMHSYLIDIITDDVILNEHISKVWLDKQDLLSLDWAAADIPIVNKLIETGWTK